jgi:hypothetical protein
LFAGLVAGHETGPREDVGDEAVEPAFEEAFSYSVNRHASEQYTFPSVCLSQARQKSGDQSISKDIECYGGGLRKCEGLRLRKISRVEVADEEFLKVFENDAVLKQMSHTGPVR